ncbi:MAG: hypothetical protein ACRCYY_05235 [Trueperaceae bacterium]
MKHFFILLLCLSSLSLAQVSYRGDVSLGGTTTYTTLEDVTSFQVALKSHFEADLTLDDLGLFLVLDPSVTVNDKSELEAEIGLTELYGRYEIGDFDFSVGLERLPLETARLSIPFSLGETSSEDVSAADPKGLQSGLLSARVLWYPGDYRFRVASFYKADDERFGVTVSAKRFFGEFELEATGIYDEHFTVGLNGSGLFGDVVVYGETWLLLNEPVADKAETSFRGLLGATGYFGDNLWILEAGYFPSLATPSSYPQLLAQYQISQSETTWTFSGGAGLLESQFVGVLASNVSVLEGETTASFNLSAQGSADVISISTGFEIKGAF